MIREDKGISAIDHVAVTVPDIEQATQFFENVFHARVVVEGLQETEMPWYGPDVETVFGLSPKGRVIARRVLGLSSGAHIELFAFDNVKPRTANRTYDYGLQHVAILVDDLQETAYRFMKAGGTLFADPDYVEDVKYGTSPRAGWLYGRTPWGTVIEMVTFQEGR
jgi:catechol 2,3-dioxygenase-like lactoylglutathione lyase family enzyme